MQKPTVGRIVHYYTDNYGFGDNEEKEPSPAVITKVHSDTCVNLKVFWDGPGIGFKTSIMLKDEGKNRWAWPPIER